MMETIYSYESRFEKDLVKVIKNNNKKRIVVVGTTCTGKSTILKNHPEYLDMDELVRKRLKSQVNKPIFGTVILDCDIIVLISLNKYLLKTRCKSRNVSYQDAINMHKGLLKEIKNNEYQLIEIRTIPDNYYYYGIIEEGLLTSDILKNIEKYYNSTRISEMNEDEYHIPFNEIEDIFNSLINIH